MTKPDPAIITAELIRLLQEELDVTATPETNLVDDLALESVQIMAFVTEVEDHFDIAIELEALADIHSLAELADLVRENLDS
ncbi:MAG: phosphopantetheine-binding protein [Pseudomonadota bacterium]